MTDKLVFRLTPEAQAAGLQLPTKAYANDAAWDLPTRGVSLYADCHKMHTGVIVDIPTGWYGQLQIRSGYAHAFILSGGVIDSGYIGEVVALVHSADNLYPPRDALQLLILPIYTLPAYDADGNVIAPRKTGVRGDNGFGSTNDV